MECGIERATNGAFRELDDRSSSLLPVIRLMDTESSCDGSEDDAKSRAQLLQECLRLRRKLAKSHSKAQDVAKLVALYKEQSEST